MQRVGAIHSPTLPPVRSTEPIERSIIALAKAPTAQEEETFQRAVCTFADDSRRAGVLPEHVIVMLREALRRSGYHLPERLERRMVEWAMLCYFARHE